MPLLVVALVSAEKLLASQSASEFELNQKIDQDKNDCGKPAYYM